MRPNQRTGKNRLFQRPTTVNNLNFWRGWGECGGWGGGGGGGYSHM